jgi:hypothetical protein
MKKFTAVAAAVLFALGGATACASDDPGINGTIESKYIEDFTEYTLVVKADNGDVHHFQVESSQWYSFAPNAQGGYGQRINTNQLLAPAEDD